MKKARRVAGPKRSKTRALVTGERYRALDVDQRKGPRACQRPAATGVDLGEADHMAELIGDIADFTNGRTKRRWLPFNPVWRARREGAACLPDALSRNTPRHAGQHVALGGRLRTD
jgi:hypothetical protein